MIIHCTFHPKINKVRCSFSFCAPCIDYQIIWSSYVIIALHLVLTEFTRHQWPRLPTHWPKYPGHVRNYPAQHCFSFCDLIGWQTIALTLNFHIWKEDSQRILRMYGTHPWDCGIPSKHVLNVLRSKAVRNSTPLPYFVAQNIWLNYEGRRPEFSQNGGYAVGFAEWLRALICHFTTDFVMLACCRLNF